MESRVRQRLGDMCEPNTKTLTDLHTGQEPAAALSAAVWPRIGAKVLPGMRFGIFVRRSIAQNRSPKATDRSAQRRFIAESPELGKYLPGAIYASGQE